MQEKLESKLNSGKIYILFGSKYFIFVSFKNMKIKIYRNATLPGFLYWHETCFLYYKNNIGLGLCKVA
jgi:hypothetical protein